MYCHLRMQLSGNTKKEAIQSPYTGKGKNISASCILDVVNTVSSFLTVQFTSVKLFELREHTTTSMSKREWAIAVLYTLSTAMEALFITGVRCSDTDIAVIWLLLAVVWGTTIIASLFGKHDDSDDIQEY